MSRPVSPTSLALAVGAGAFLGALIAAVGVGAWEVRGGEFARDLAPAVGLLGVVFSLLAVPVAAWVAAVHGPSRLSWSLQLESAKRRYRLLLLAPFLPLGWYVVGHGALLAFGRFESKRLAALVLTLATVGTLWLGKELLDAAATWLGRHRSRPDLLLSVGVALLGSAAVVALLVKLGTPSGTGGPFALFGVLRRDELVLEPAIAALVAVALGYGCAWLGARFGFGKRAWFTLAGLALSVAAGAAAAWGASSATAVRFERSPTTSGRLFVAAQGLTDRDRDGSPRAFGGGDCDDRNAEVRPGAWDRPGDGIDQDCSGADAVAKPATADTSPGTSGAAGSSPAAGSAAGSAATARAKLPEHPNVILLTVDTMRAELGYTRGGAAPRLSPNLDRLAAKSTVFDRAYSLASYTSKSLGPAMIGRYPSETDRNWDHFDRFAPSVPFVQERLQKAGVHTASVQGYWYFFLKGYGFERGWDTLDKSAAPRVISVDADGSSTGAAVGDRTVAALEALRDEPRSFLLWAHWVDPHAEYVKHAEFDFGSESRERYDGEIAFVDAQLGRVLTALESSPQAARTLVIVTSDHGEAFGEHGLIRHGFELWEELVRVPLLVYVPGAAPAKVTARRSAIDLVPTLLEIFGVSAPSGEDFVRGRSWLDDVGKSAGNAERPILVDMPQGPNNKERRAFLSGPYKLITSDERVLGLYDLEKDPAEKQDLSADAALLGRVQAERAAFLADLRPLPAKR